MALPFQNSVRPVHLPTPYTPQGVPVVPNGVTTAVPANTLIDFMQLQSDLAVLTPGRQVQLFSVFAMAEDFRNGYVGRPRFSRDVRLSLDYVGTAGVHLASLSFPNSYGGADPGFAPFTSSIPLDSPRACTASNP